MKKKALFYIILLLHSALFAQNELKPIVVNSAGNTFKNGNSTLYYSVGEAAITTISSGSSTLLQGFLQTDVATSIDTSSCRYKDSLQLITLYTATNGANWTNKWDLSKPMSTWYGITLNAQGCVICIDLDGGTQQCANNDPPNGGNNLNGTLPNLNLPELKSLILQDNKLLGGAIPLLEKCTKLDRIHLGGCAFSGNIPAFTQSSLTIIEFCCNQLTGSIPNQIALNCPNLQNFYVHTNSQLTGNLPPDFGNLLSLNYFVAYSCNFTGCYPISYNKLCNKPEINFGSNPKLPHQGDFGEYCKLKTSIGAACDDGNANTINDVIDATCLCKGQLKIDTASCRYKDSLQLITLYTATNGANWTNKWDTSKSMSTWYGITLNAQGCVECIDMDGGASVCATNDFPHIGNNLDGTLPNLNLPELKILSLYANKKLGGTLPLFEKSTKLEQYCLGGCNFIGTIPIFAQSTLRYIALCCNQLTSSIPNQIALNCPNLIGFYAENNKLSGSLPPDFGNLLKLDDYNVSSNDLSGCFPASYNNLCSKTKIYIDKNPKLPHQGNFAEYCKSKISIGAPCDDGNPNTSNDAIDGATCLCKGQLKIDTASCRYKDSLALVDFYKATKGDKWVSKNANGQISPWVLSNPITTWYGVRLNANGCVECLDLDGDTNYCGGYSLNPAGMGLSGLFPNSVCRLTELGRLHLRGNTGLNGTIPDSIQYLKKLFAFYIDGCSINGPLPNGFKNLSSLLDFTIHNNPLMMELPTFLKDLKKIGSFEAGNTKLYGAIPTEIGQMDSLKNFRVCCNELSGTVPVTLANLFFNQLLIDNNNLDSLPPLNFKDYNWSWDLPKLSIHNNHFTFDDILPNIAKTTAKFNLSYNPQDSCGKYQSLTYTEGQNLLIDVGIDYGITSNTYQWYKGSQKLASQTNRQLNINALQSTDAGDYYCEIKNPNALDLTLNRRLIKVTVNKQPCPTLPKPIFTNSTETLCEGKTINAGTWNKYLWSTNATTASIAITKTGIYYVTVYDNASCPYNDTVQVTIKPKANTVLNETICNGAIYTLNNTAYKNSGTYTTTMTTINGCDSTITLNLKVNQINVALDNDFIACENQALTLDGSKVKDCQNCQWLWNTGATTSSINIKAQKASIYIVTVTNSIGCTSIDSIFVQIQNKEDFKCIDDFFELENNDKIQLEVYKNDKISKPSDYLWQIVTVAKHGQASFDNKQNIDFEPKIVGFATGDTLSYRACPKGCPTNCDTAKVYLTFLKDCITEFKDSVYNFITPGQDALNRVFDPLGDIKNNCPVQERLAELRIFNSLGEMIYRAKPYYKWYGTRNNKPEGDPFSSGTYYYQFSVFPEKGKAKHLEGKILLIEKE